MKHFCFLFIIIICLTSCQDRVHNRHDITTFLISTDNALQFSEKLTPVDSIILTSNNNNLPKTITGCKIFNDTIYLIDNNSSRGFYRFNINGEECGTLTGIGRRECDVLAYTAMDVDSNYIYILDSPNNRVVAYHKTLTYSHHINVQPLSSAIAVNSDGSIYVDRNNASTYNGTNTSGMLFRYLNGKEECILNIPEQLKDINILPINNFCNVGDGTLNFIPCMQPTIYSLSEDSAVIKYKIDFGNAWIPDEELKKFKNKPLFKIVPEIINHGYIVGPSFLENENWLVLYFHKDTDNYFYIRQKKQEKSILVKSKDENSGSPFDISGDTVYMIKPNSNHILMYNLSSLQL